MSQLAIALLLSLGAFYSAIIAPLKILGVALSQSVFLPLDLFVSGLFVFDFFYHRNKISPSQKVMSIISAFPVELLFLFSSTPKALALFSVVRLYRFFSAYRVLVANRIEGRFYKLYFILLGVVSAIHFIACSWMALNSTSYLKSLYWTITTLTTTGYGDITPTTDAGRLFTIFVMVMGFSAFGIIVGNVSNLLMAKNRHSEAKKERLEDLAMFMRHYEVPRKLQIEIFSFYDHQIKKRLSDNDGQIISDLPLALRKEVSVYMKIKLIREIPIFKGLSRSCLNMIAKSLEQVSFTAEETIIEVGDQAEEMYIIDHGEVAISDEAGNYLATLKQGQCFGEIALLKEVLRTARVQAINYCDAYCFKKEDFITIGQLYPELEKNLKKVMEQRLDPKKAA